MVLGYIEDFCKISKLLSLFMIFNKCLCVRCVCDTYKEKETSEYNLPIR